MMNYCKRVGIVCGLIIFVVVSVFSVSNAKSTVGKIMKDIPIHPKGEVAYAATITLNGRIVTGVVYNLEIDVDDAIEYYRAVLRDKMMTWTECVYPLDWLPIDGIRVHDFSIHDKGYSLLFPVMEDMLIPSRALVVVAVGYDESIYCPGKENGGKDIVDLPRFPGSVRTLCLEYSGQDDNPPATVLLYETMSSVESVYRHFNDVLNRYGWASFQDYGMNLPMVPRMLSGFTDDRQCMIGVFLNEETGMTSIVIMLFKTE